MGKSAQEASQVNILGTPVAGANRPFSGANDPVVNVTKWHKVQIFFHNSYKM